MQGTVMISLVDHSSKIFQAMRLVRTETQVKRLDACSFFRCWICHYLSGSSGDKADTGEATTAVVVQVAKLELLTMLQQHLMHNQKLTMGAISIRALMLEHVMIPLSNMLWNIKLGICTWTTAFIPHPCSPSIWVNKEEHLTIFQVSIPYKHNQRLEPTSNSPRINRQLVDVTKMTVLHVPCKTINPSSPEHFSWTYFPKGGATPPSDYQCGRSYNPKLTTIV